MLAKAYTQLVCKNNWPSPISHSDIEPLWTLHIFGPLQNCHFFGQLLDFVYGHIDFCWFYTGYNHMRSISSTFKLKWGIIVTAGDITIWYIVKLRKRITNDKSYLKWHTSVCFQDIFMKQLAKERRHVKECNVKDCKTKSNGFLPYSPIKINAIVKWKSIRTFFGLIRGYLCILWNLNMCHSYLRFLN